MVLDPGAAGCILSAPLKELREASKWTNLSLAVTSGSARACVDGGLSQLSAPDRHQARRPVCAFSWRLIPKVKNGSDESSFALFRL